MSMSVCHAGRELRVGGFVPLSTGDFPGQLSAVVFCQGCPWRCRYCHNPHLQPVDSSSGVAWDGLLRKLERRRGLVDAVVFSGGEPTAQPNALADAVQATRSLGFRIGLHTAGIYPRPLERLLPQLDWVGFDIKAMPSGYLAVTGVQGAEKRAEESLRLLIASGVPHEVRTTVHPDLVAREDLLRLAGDLSRLGVRRYALQAFRSQGCADDSLVRAGAQAGPDTELCDQMATLFESFEVRRA